MTLLCGRPYILGVAKSGNSSAGLVILHVEEKGKHYLSAHPTPVSILFDMIKEVEKIFHFTIVLKDKERNDPIRGTIHVGFKYEASKDIGERNTTDLNLHAE